MPLDAPELAPPSFTLSLPQLVAPGARGVLVAHLAAALLADVRSAATSKAEEGHP